MIWRAGLTECTFKRRLERTESTVDEASWQVGYEEVAFFRRLFKCTTGLSPSAYRRRFSIPDYARSNSLGASEDSASRGRAQEYAC